MYYTAGASMFIGLIGFMVLQHVAKVNIQRSNFSSLRFNQSGTSDTSDPDGWSVSSSENLSNLAIFDEKISKFSAIFDENFEH